MDLNDEKVRDWWLRVWGNGAQMSAAVHDPKEPTDDLYTRNGMLNRVVTWRIQPIKPMPSLDALQQLETEICNARERDEWMMRKLAALIKPQKHSLLTVQFANDSHSSNSKRAKHTQPDLVDPDEPIGDTLFDARIALLDLLQHYHLQFDSVRRARYSTGAILAMLENTFEHN